MRVTAELRQIIGRIPFIKRARVKKWVRFSQRSVLPKKKVDSIGNDPDRVRKAIEKQLRTFPDIAADLHERLEKILHAHPDLAPFQTDMLFYYFAYGFSLNEYVCYDFSHKTHSERMAFISDRESIIYGYRMNELDSMAVLSDKMATYEKFKSYFKRDAIAISCSDDFSLFSNFIDQHPIFVKKEVRQACGRSVELIDFTCLNQSRSELFELLLSRGKTILEEAVQQNPATAIFNPSSVNTIRCITMNTHDGIVTPFCFMKIGRQGAFIDNGAAGGILVSIDEMTGILNSDGVDELGHRYVYHPESGVQFNGYALPEWDTMISICKDMAAQLPNIRFIGWDMAYSTDGWLVIEGNALSEVIGPQSTGRKGIRKRMDTYMRKMDLEF